MSGRSLAAEPSPELIPLTPGTPSPEPDGHWVLAGVAAELAGRLRASAAFIRLLLFIAGYVHIWLVLGIYSALAVVLPRDGRRYPGWVNLAALLRVFALLGVVEIPFRFDFSNGVFNQSPAVWIPVAGTSLLAWLVILNSRRPVNLVPDSADRRSVLSAAIPLTAAAGLTGIAAVAPQAPVGRLLDLVLIGLGLVASLTGRRLNIGWFSAACLPLGLLALLLAGSGARLAGGLGDLTVTPAAAGHARSYSRAVGDVRLDLSGLRPPDGSSTAWAVNVGIGRLELDVPSDALTTVKVSIGSGTLNGVPMDRRGGPPSRVLLRRSIVITPQQASAGTFFHSRFRLTIDATVGQGCVVINSASEHGSC
jgi:phage shock protein PspC (stress-responsive transcriptional regulator)